MKKTIFMLMLGALIAFTIPGKAGPPGLDQRTQSMFVKNSLDASCAIQIVDKNIIEVNVWNLTAVETFGRSDSDKPPAVAVSYSRYKNDTATLIYVQPCNYKVLRC